MANVVEQEQEGRLGQGQLSRGRAAAAFVWPCALLVGAAVLGFAALRPRASLSVAVPVLGAKEPVEAPGLEARLAERGLRVRVAPFHADPRRQVFETQALRARFGRREGEPYRVELLLDEDAAPMHVDLGALAIADARGAALEPLVRVDASKSIAPDPVRTLLEAGPLELAPGASTTCVFWGRAPSDGARITGLDAAPLALTATRWATAPLDDVLARVPAPPEDEAGR